MHFLGASNPGSKSFARGVFSAFGEGVGPYGEEDFNSPLLSAIHTPLHSLLFLQSSQRRLGEAQYFEAFMILLMI